MDKAQIIEILNTAIYQNLPTLVVDFKEITFKALICDLIDFIDGVRMRRYMVIIINKAIGINNHNGDSDSEEEAEEAEEIDVANQELDELINEGFGEGEQRWIDHFTSIVELATEEQLFIMLNILGILNLGPDLGPDPAELILMAMNINNDATNNMNNNNYNYMIL